MNTQDANETSVSLEKAARRKKGLTFFLIAIGCLVLRYILFSLDITGIIPALITLAMIILFIMGLMSFIKS
jgi:hypothetical protein